MSFNMNDYRGGKHRAKHYGSYIWLGVRARGKLIERDQKIEELEKINKIQAKQIVKLMEENKILKSKKLKIKLPK